MANLSSMILPLPNPPFVSENDIPPEVTEGNYVTSVPTMTSIKSASGIQSLTIVES